jgi:hypothetical protein
VTETWSIAITFNYLVTAHSPKDDCALFKVKRKAVELVNPPFPNTSRTANLPRLKWWVTGILFE